MDIYDLGEEMMTSEELIALSVPYDPSPAVYFLIDRYEIVYVGQSMSPMRRIGEHRKSKTFDRYTIIPTDRENLDSMEAGYYISLLPKLNGSLPRSSIFSTWKALKRETGMNHWELLRYCAEKGIKPVAPEHYARADFSEVLK